MTDLLHPAISLLEWVYLPVAIMVAVVLVIAVGFLSSGDNREGSAIFVFLSIAIAIVWPAAIIIAVLSLPFWIGRGIRHLVLSRDTRGARHRERADSRKARLGKYGQ